MGFLRLLKRSLSSLHAFLLRSNWNELASLVNDLRRLFITKTEARQRHDWVKDYVLADYWVACLVQKQIYILEELDSLRSLAMADSLIELGDTDIRQETSSEALHHFEETLAVNTERLWVMRQHRANVLTRHPAEYLILDFYIYRQKAERFKRMLCMVRGGCCARDCGCCEEYRKPSTGQGIIGRATKAHCTERCGCCIRHRRFEDLSDGTVKWVEGLGIFPVDNYDDLERAPAALARAYGPPV